MDIRIPDVHEAYIEGLLVELQGILQRSVAGALQDLIGPLQEGKTEDILALDAFDRRYLHVPREEWAGTVIRAIDVEGF